MEQQKRRQSSCSSNGGGGGEKTAAANAVINVRNNNSSSNTSSTATTPIISNINNNSVSSNNIPKMLKIVKNVSNLGDKMMENENNLAIPKLRLQQTTIKNDKNIDKNVDNTQNVKITQDITSIASDKIEKVEKLVENKAMETNCNNTYVVETLPTNNLPSTIPEENKNQEKSNNGNNNIGLVSPRFGLFS